MFEKWRKKQHKFNLLELKDNHYYILFVERSKDVKEIKEALDILFADNSNSPRVLLLPKEEVSGMRVIEIG